MKFKNIFLFLLFFSPSLIGANKPDVVVLPLYMVLIEPSDSAATQVGGMAGVVSGVGAILSFKNPKKVLGDKLFNTLDGIEKKESHNYKAFWQGKEAPELIYKSLLGAANLWATVKHKLHQSGCDQASLNLAEIPFNPQTHAKVMELNPKAVELIKHLRQTGRRVLIADNANQENIDALKSKFEFLKTVDMFVSGEIQTIKSPEFYKSLFKKFNINPAQCILIETHPEYGIYAMNAGMPSQNIVQCTHQDHAGRNVSDIKKELKEKYNIKV